VILCTMPFRYRLSPAWKYRQPLAYDAANQDQVAEHLEEGTAALERGDAAAAIEAFDLALLLEPEVPVLRYLKARALERAGDPDSAEQWYGRARDAVVGNLGSVESLNQRIRLVAREDGVGLADLKVEFDRRQHALGGHFNRDLFVDDCHPSREGQRLIAKVLARLLE